MSDNPTRAENIALMVSSPSRLDRFIDPGLPDELLDFRPDLEDVWTIRELLVHLVDADAVLYVRVRRAIAEPGVEGWPLGKTLVEKWHPGLDYSGQSVAEAVEGLQAVRALTVGLVRRIADQDWSGYYTIRPDGQKAYLEDLVRIESSHIDTHLEQIERNERL